MIRGPCVGDGFAGSAAGASEMLAATGLLVQRAKLPASTATSLTTSLVRAIYCGIPCRARQDVRGLPELLLLAGLPVTAMNNRLVEPVLQKLSSSPLNTGMCGTNATVELLVPRTLISRDFTPHCPLLR